MGRHVYRPEFVKALTLLGQVCRLVTHSPGAGSLPVLVGGAIVEFDTGGAFMSGEFDFVTEIDGPFVVALESVGFVQDRRPGHIRRPGGWVHPLLLVGVDMISGRSSTVGRTGQR